MTTPKVIYTIGHSTRTLESLIATLKHYHIQTVVDVRHFPHSRHNPQFNQELLETELSKQGINYQWLESLGGYRSGGYRKYTKTKEFAQGLKQLIKIAQKSTTAIMCAEILWFRCHRRYLADAFKRRKWQVLHIYDEQKVDKHKITFRRKIKCDRIKRKVYPEPAAERKPI
jgi:uncharacterized protein (DUF488 family)